MRRTALAVAALAVSAVLPAHADYPPTDCSAFLVLAPTGGTSGCNTIGAAPIDGADHRVLNVAVQTGQVEATLGCGGDGWNPYPEVKTIVVTAPWTGNATVNRTSYCWLTLRALVDGTTAVATNTTGATQK